MIYYIKGQTFRSTSAVSLCERHRKLTQKMPLNVNGASSHMLLVQNITYIWHLDFVNCLKYEKKIKIWSGGV